MNGTPRRSATRSSTSAMPTPASPDVQRYRGAVIGAGGTARQSHLPALRTGAGVRARIDIVAVVDSAVDVPPVDGIPLLWHPAELAVYRLTADPGREAGGTPWRGTSAAGRGGVLLDHGTHLIYQMLDVAGLPAAVSAWTGRLRHRAYEVEDTASVHFEYPERLVTMFFTWAARQRENRIRFAGEHGAIEWVGGELRLERGGRLERHDFS